MTLKRFLLGLATLLAILLPEAAPAQVVTVLPVYVDGTSAAGVLPPTDFGNGPLEFKILQGSGVIFTASGAGLGSTSGSSTTLTLTATAAANPPCVGCIISGTGITSGTTVAAFNGTTTITLSAAMTVAASTPLAWGMACPTTAAGVKGAFAQVGQPGGSDLPFYTQARICGYANNGPGMSVLPLAIGAH